MTDEQLAHLRAALDRVENAPAEARWTQVFPAFLRVAVACEWITEDDCEQLMTRALDAAAAKHALGSAMPEPEED